MTTSDQYVVITSSDDGAWVEQISGTELQKRLNEQYYGDNPRFQEACPAENHTSYWVEDTIIILRALFVVPKAVQVMKEYEL